METDFFGNEWHLVFANADGYVAAVTDVKVNGTSWEKSSFKPSAGGKYFIDTENNQIVFSAERFQWKFRLTGFKKQEILWRSQQMVMKIFRSNLL